MFAVLLQRVGKSAKKRKNTFNLLNEKVSNAVIEMIERNRNGEIIEKLVSENLTIIHG